MGCMGSLGEEWGTIKGEDPKTGEPGTSVAGWDLNRSWPVTCLALVSRGEETKKVEPLDFALLGVGWTPTQVPPGLGARSNDSQPQQEPDREPAEWPAFRPAALSQIVDGDIADIARTVEKSHKYRLQELELRLVQFIKSSNEVQIIKIYYVNLF